MLNEHELELKSRYPPGVIVTFCIPLRTFISPNRKARATQTRHILQQQATELKTREIATANRGTRGQNDGLAAPKRFTIRTGKLVVLEHRDSRRIPERHKQRRIHALHVSRCKIQEFRHCWQSPIDHLRESSSAFVVLRWLGPSEFCCGAARL